MKNINKYLVESRRNEYRVSFVDLMDEEDLPITVSIIVDNANVKAFEEYLEKEQDNLFVHAEGGNIEY